MLKQQTQAVLLLTAYFSKPGKDDPRPLTPSEWGRFAAWLKEQGRLPEDLLMWEPATVLKSWTDRTVTVERIQYLLGRSSALALALEKWRRAGIWVLARSDPEYPFRLKQRLKNESPPLLFGCGNQRLLQQGGLAVIGSRQATVDDLEFAQRVGAQAALQGFGVISGGARGVDQAAMSGALEQEGTVTGVLADSLLRAATSARYRQGLLTNNLVLVSPFYPEAGFDVGNAMARNKYIYCLADAALVVCSTQNKGGTWSGAVENLKYGWAPLWVRPTAASTSGNAALAKAGAQWFLGEPFDMSDLFTAAINRPGEGTTNSLIDSTHPAMTNSADYQYFLRRLETLTAHEAKSTAQLSSALNLDQSQLREWLKRATAEQRIQRFSRPVRYQWRASKTLQHSLFKN